MKILGRIIKWLILLLYFISLIYILLENVKYSDFFGIPYYTIPAIAVISILITGYNYIKIYLKVNVLEFEFTSIVNHTFRTPLTRIMWSLKEIKDTETTKETLLYTQNIENAASRILNIVDILVGLQEVDNRASYFFKPLSIREIMESSISKYREVINEKKFNFKISTFTDIPLLTADLKKMTFVFDVIMENALYYTPQGGNITVGAKRERDKIIFYAADSGIGLTFRDRMRIFSRFFRSERARHTYTDGMGLGLYLAKQIVKKHGGKMYAKSKGINKGTTVFVELPIKNSNGQIK